MPTNMTLKNVPDDIYSRLKNAAEAHHRSINSEIIACLERTLLPSKPSKEELIAKARSLRLTLKPGKFKVEDIASAIKQGRP
jgi:antitoxin FitA